MALNNFYLSWLVIHILCIKPPVWFLWARWPNQQCQSTEVRAKEDKQVWLKTL